MKRIFAYYSYKDRWYVSEKECRAMLGDEYFEAMMKEAVEKMDQRNSLEYDFTESILSGEKSPYFDWCVEERTPFIRHKLGVVCLAALICAVMALIGRVSDPAPWIQSMFLCIGLLTLAAGSAMKIWATLKMSCYWNDIGIPVFLSGLLMVSGHLMLTM